MVLATLQHAWRSLPVFLGKPPVPAFLPLFVLVITRLQIEPEEAVLATLFGPAYGDYCAHVGRWFGRRG